MLIELVLTRFFRGLVLGVVSHVVEGYGHGGSQIPYLDVTYKSSDDINKVLGGKETN